MIEVGTLTRNLDASAGYAIEDELDWEHLPWVHASTFASVDLVNADRNGWEANVVLRDGTPMLMRVTLDEDRLGYTNATFSDGVENGRAVARLEPTGDRSCRMHLKFYVPDRPGLDVRAAGEFYVSLFNRLIDEDEPKMVHRERFMTVGPAAKRERKSVRLADGTDCQVPLLCPHQGLPLDAVPNSQGVITCPWHGYRFDARTGQCLSGQIRGWQ